MRPEFDIVRAYATYRRRLIDSVRAYAKIYRGRLILLEPTPSSE